MAILGAVVGDIIGAQYEFNRPRTLDWANVPLIGKSGVGYTDDTVMALAIKKALDCNLDLIATMVDVGRRYPYCGYGGQFSKWIMGSNHQPYNSWGNGSAMRVVYVGEFFEDYQEMQKMAAATAAVSHNHPEGIKGAVVTATCIWMVRHGKSKDDVYKYVLAEYPTGKYPYSIDKDMEYLRKNYKWTEKCSDTVPAAIRCFYESSDYESFMRNIFSLDCDSDTFGAIAGGIVEEYYNGFGKLDGYKIAKEYLSAELWNILQGMY